jgi:transposase-like protein
VKNEVKLYCEFCDYELKLVHNFFEKTVNFKCEKCKREWDSKKLYPKYNINKEQ